MGRHVSLQPPGGSRGEQFCSGSRSRAFLEPVLRAGRAGGRRGGPAGSLGASRGVWARIPARPFTPAPRPSSVRGVLPSGGWISSNAEMRGEAQREASHPAQLRSWAWAFRPGGPLTPRLRAADGEQGLGRRHTTNSRQRRDWPGLQRPRPALLALPTTSSKGHQEEGSCCTSSWAHPRWGGLTLLWLPGPREDPMRPPWALLHRPSWGSFKSQCLFLPAGRPRGCWVMLAPVASVGEGGESPLGTLPCSVPNSLGRSHLQRSLAQSPRKGEVPGLTGKRGLA